MGRGERALEIDDDGGGGVGGLSGSLFSFWLIWVIFYLFTVRFVDATIHPT